ncbi:MAG: aldehyde:ferredoxin oxidoreductase [Spirochaetes bacterium]|nr:aldehyde:ferredoxin oxidoreductase [Spirochaetota bacterium]
MIYKEYIRVLNIELSTGKIRIDQREDLMQYLGGVGVAAKLLEENVKPSLPPLDPEQPAVFAIGPLTYVYPVMTKTVAMFVSPLTGELGESYAGGRFGTMLFSAGFDAVVLTGKAPRPSFLSIKPDNVGFRDARAVWGGSTGDDVGRILSELEPGSGKRSFIRIGPAGENLVSYACVIVDRYRHFGRLGLGAVLGSKNLKAIAVTGGRSIPVRNFKEYTKAYQEIYKKCVSTDIMAKYHDVGTPINIEPLNALGALPTENMRRGSFEKAADISGEAFSAKNLARKLSCVGCPVGCIHIGQFRRKFAEHGHEYETVLEGYDYELIFALGTFLCISSSDDILELIEAVEEAGLDAMSAGVALGWATEALERGLVSEEETLLPLKFADKEPYIRAIGYIAKPPNDFYRLLGKGVRAASRRYGGEDFAMQIAGNEMAGYHTGYGSLVGAAIGARHSHLCNGGYAFDQEGKGFDPEALLDKLEKEEVERCMLNSLVMCLFARKVYDRPTVLSALNALGWNLSDEDLSDIALRNYKTKLRIKKALGFTLNTVRLPKRFFETESFNGKLDEQVAHDMLAAYQKRVANLLAEE